MSDLQIQKTGWSPLLCAPIVALCLMVAGCGGRSEEAPSGSVKGTVTVNGNPVAGRVNFVGRGAGAGASADLKDDGSFQLDGPLPVGEYAVFVTAPGLGDQPPSEDARKDQPAKLKSIPQKYQSEASSDLVAKVVAGPNDFKFDLK